MKKFVLALMVAAAALFGIAGPAAAQYPPGTPGPTPDNLNPPAGSTVNITVNAAPGETVTVNLGPNTATGVAGADGSVVIPITVPTAAGPVTGTVTGSTTGPLGTFTVTVQAVTDPGGGLPATGSDGTATTTWIAAALLASGLGLFGVATVRRRQPTNA